MAAELQDFKKNGKRSAFGGQRSTFNGAVIGGRSVPLIGFEGRLEYADECVITACAKVER
jgi:hypothetical protein